MAVVRICPDCSRPLKDGQIICTSCAMMMGREAAAAFDEVHTRDPKLSPDALVRDAIAYIESGHARHRSPQLGCPFCRIPA